MRKKTPQKKMTLKRVAEMISNLDMKLIHVDGKIDRVETNLEDRIEKLAVGTAKQFEATDARFDRLEQSVDAFKAETREHFGKIHKDLFEIRDNYVRRKTPYSRIAHITENKPSTSTKRGD